jgi:hypothetical protein
MLQWTNLPRWVRLALMAVGSRLLALAAMVAGSYFPRPDDDLHWVGHEGGFYWDQVPIRVLDVWGRWDTMYYLSIARDGYAPRGEGWAYQAAYFPLFPSMMRGLSVVLGGLEPYLAGVALAFGLFALALVYLDKLVRLDHSPELAERVLLLLLAFPGTHFLTCVYPESTALFLAVFAVYNARTGRPLVAGLSCMLAAIARSSGIFITAAVLLELLRDREGRWRLTPWVLVTLLPALPLAFWLGLNLERFGDPLYFMHVQAGWGRHPSFPLEPLFRFDLSLDYHLITLAAVALTIYLWRVKERLSYSTLASLNVLLPLSTGMLRGVHRYMTSNFPVFIAGARFFEARQRWLKVYVVFGLGLMTLFAFKWGQGYQPN